MRSGSGASRGALVLLAAGGMACAARAPQGDVAGEVALAAELLAAVDAQHLDGALFARALSGTPMVRRLAVQAAGQSRSRHLAPALRALAADPDSGAAARAAFAAGLLVDTGAISALTAALAAPSAVAVEAAWALGEVGEPARDAIVAALGTPNRRDEAVTAELLVAASKLRPVPVAAVAPHAGARSMGVREAAAYAVGRPRVAAGVRLLLGLAADVSAETRGSVARGLTRSAVGDSLAAAARSALDRLADDPVPAVRVAALRSLGSYPDMRETVVAALRDADANVRVAAAEAAAPLVGRDDARAWAPLWDADTSFAVRRALLAVEAPRPAALLARAGEWARDPDWRRRAAAARALLPAGGDPRPLAPLVADPDARVRAAAYGALGDALDSAVAQPELRAALLRGVGDTDAIVRGTAIGALAARPSVVELPTVRAAYDAAAGDRDNDARLAALRYLARLWEATGARVPAGDRARLFELPAIADPLELAAATGLPGVPASPPRMPAPRPASYYRAVAADLLVPAIRGAPAPRVVVRTVRGDLTLALHASDAPLTVRNFLDLVERGYYAGTRFHRVVPGFVTQDGDPRGDGNGGPGYAIRDEQNRRRYARGAVGMALSGPNTGGSQYFVTLTRQPHLDGHYTVFGRLVAGAESLDGLVQGDSIFDVRVVR